MYLLDASRNPKIDSWKIHRLLLKSYPKYKMERFQLFQPFSLPSVRSFQAAFDVPSHVFLGPVASWMATAGVAS